WWAEAYSEKVGWALGDLQQHGNDPEWDKLEAEKLYELLEKEIVPEFYERNEKGIPGKWIEKMRNSMGQLTPRFSANRTVREYTEKYYVPAASGFVKRAADNSSVGRQIVEITRELENRWQGIAFGKIDIKMNANGFTYSLPLFLNGIAPEYVSVQLYADGTNGEAPEINSMVQDTTTGKESGHVYSVEIKTSRSPNDYTVRVIPHYLDIAVPLENNLICWQH
ncbi:MAG: hypothetical protein ACTHNG_11185, partial [Ginsengibacter sp.]